MRIFPALHRLITHPTRRPAKLPRACEPSRSGIREDTFASRWICGTWPIREFMAWPRRPRNARKRRGRGRGFRRTLSRSTTFHGKTISTRALSIAESRSRVANASGTGVYNSRDNGIGGRAIYLRNTVRLQDNVPLIDKRT